MGKQGGIPVVAPTPGRGCLTSRSPHVSTWRPRAATARLPQSARSGPSGKGRLALNAVPEKYTAMRSDGRSSEDVYRAAWADGFKRHECLLIVAGLFNLELHEAREIGHKVYASERLAP